MSCLRHSRPSATSPPPRTANPNASGHCVSAWMPSTVRPAATVLAAGLTGHPVWRQYCAAARKVRSARMDRIPPTMNEATRSLAFGVTGPGTDADGERHDDEGEIGDRQDRVSGDDVPHDVVL